MFLQAPPPYFFHCHEHLRQVRDKRRTVAPAYNRDHGLCIVCGNPAEPSSINLNTRGICVRAEQTNSTVARVRTLNYCPECKLLKDSLCKGATCRANQTQNPVLPQGCCNTTAKGRVRHCAQCCQAARQNPPKSLTLDRIRDQATAARRKARDQRRTKVARLMRQGLSTKKIAERLKEKLNTIQQDAVAIRKSSTALLNPKERIQYKQQQVLELSGQGLGSRKIAPLVGLHDSTVRKILAQQKDPSAKKPDKEAILARRRKVAALRNKGLTAKKIAAELETTIDTVWTDIKTLRKEASKTPTGNPSATPPVDPSTGRPGDR